MNLTNVEHLEISPLLVTVSEQLKVLRISYRIFKNFEKPESELRLRG